MIEQEYVIGHYRLQPGRQLLADGVPVDISAKALDVLCALVRAAGDLVTKDELLERVWPGLVVAEHNIQVHVSALRRALSPRDWIVTVPRRGYRFTGPVGASLRGEHKSDPQASVQLDAAPHGDDLPRPLTELVGREADVSAVLHALGRGGIVTLTGVGGVGKTRLALEVATRLLGTYRDGVFLVDLAVLGEPGLVATAVASALDVPLASDRPPLESISSRIRSRHILLVLDNCEHVVHAAAELAEAIAQAGHRITLLATSRESLACRGEQVLRLSPLDLPGPDVASADEALQAPAVALLAERAHAADSNFELTDADAAAAGRICHHLDGLPLAIELAGAWVPAFGMAELERRLDTSFDLPGGGNRTLAPRQQSLQATLDWSHALLSEQEKCVLRRLAVFTGYFSLASAVAAVADKDMPASQVADALGQLARKSLAAMKPGSAPTAYRLLETTRAYAWEKLATANEVQAMRHRHAVQVADRVRLADLEWDCTPDQTWDERHLPVMDDLRSALDWTTTTPGEEELALAMTGRSWRLWVSAGLAAEGRRRAEASAALLGPATPASVAAAVWTALGVGINSSPNEGIARLRRAASLYRKANDPIGRGDALVYVGQACAMYGESWRATRALTEARRLLDQRAGPKRLAICAMAFGMLHAAAGRWNDVRNEYETAVALCRRAGAERLLALTLYNLADAIWIEGDLDAAIDAGREALAQARVVGGAGHVGGSAGLLAGVLTARGRLDEALAIAREALPLCHEDNYVAWLFDHLALRAAKAGRLQDGARLLGYATQLHGGNPRQLNEQRAADQLWTLLHKTFGEDETGRLTALGALLNHEQASTLALAADS